MIRRTFLQLLSGLPFVSNLFGKQKDYYSTNRLGKYIGHDIKNYLQDYPVECDLTVNFEYGYEVYRSFNIVNEDVEIINKMSPDELFSHFRESFDKPYEIDFRTGLHEFEFVYKNKKFKLCILSLTSNRLFCDSDYIS